MVPKSVARTVAVDTDPGVDDALALLLALRSPELRVELITTVAGNVPVEMATANASRILALVRPTKWPVFAEGAARPLKRTLQTATSVHGEDGLGGLTRLQRPDGTPRFPASEGLVAKRRASERLIELVGQYGEDLTVIALGPLTNIARAIERAPDTMQQLGRLIIMGGAIAVPGNVTPTAEFNIYVDPHAASLVLTSGLHMTLVPLDVTRQVRLTSAFLREKLRTSRSRSAQAIRYMSHDLLHGRERAHGMPLHDPLAVAVALDPSLVKLSHMSVRVETRGEHTIGMTIADRRDGERRVNTGPAIDVAMEVDGERVLELFADRVLGPPSRAPIRHRRGVGVIVVGSANTDFTVATRQLPIMGETVIGSSLQTTFGGKGANQAVAARRAGAQVFFIGKLGEDQYGHAYAEHLRREGIELSGLRWDREVPSGVALITVDRRGHNQITVAPGANATLIQGDLDALSDFFDSARVLLVQLEIPLTTVEVALRQAKTAGLTTVLNPAPARRLPPQLTAITDILIPNEVEASMLTGQPVTTVRQARSAAQDLCQLGYRIVVITLGRHGVVWAEAQRVRHVPGLKVEAKDTTGAGDTFVGYLACALAEGKVLRDALELANAASALSVTQAGAQLSVPRRRGVDRFLDES